MLVAYGPEGQPVMANETALEQLQRWSQERALYCPNCKGLLHVRGGPEKRMQLHFAHQRGECAWSTEFETERHMRGKAILAGWLREQFPRAAVTLEERLPGPNRIADVFVRHEDGSEQAVEFQCAPLDLEEWRHRHEAYRAAGIVDTWIIGNNRREKQEAFIEGIVGVAHEVLFLDPLAIPPRCWLRWRVNRDELSLWQQEAGKRLLLEGWVGRPGYGATIIGRLQEVRLGIDGRLYHQVRAVLQERVQLTRAMSKQEAADEATLRAYLRPLIDDGALHSVVLPLLRAYLRDTDLLRRYNYGRGHPGQLVREADAQRVQQARSWLGKLIQQGYDVERLRELGDSVPRIGPYAAFASYMETLISLVSYETY
ncbi:MAG TPA: competence protein CoiA family protein [Ktedonobacteraceae bacterium]|jgi:hypothetical protein|nr:competence protein CoiA family protein [Ktedonobacteraceae bacterium]